MTKNILKHKRIYISKTKLLLGRKVCILIITIIQFFGRGTKVLSKTS